MDKALQALFVMLDRLTVAYLSYRAGKLTVTVEQFKELEKVMDEVRKIHAEIDAGNYTDVDDYFNRGMRQ